MLGFILTLLVIGAIVGFAFSAKGKESDGALNGAKKGAGCAIKIILALIFLVALLLLIIFSE